MKPVHKASIFIIIIAAAGLAIAIGFSMRNQKQGSVLQDAVSEQQPGSQANSATSTEAWETYANANLGIRLQYPPNVSRQPDRVIGEAFRMPNAAQFISLKADHTQYNAGNFFGFISNDSACLTPPQSTETEVSNVATTTINGVPFLTFRAFSPAAGQFMRWQEYRALHDGRCYILSGQISGEESSHIADLVQRQAADNELTSIQNAFASIAQTFQFASGSDGQSLNYPLSEMVSYIGE